VPTIPTQFIELIPYRRRAVTCAPVLRNRELYRAL